MSARFSSFAIRFLISLFALTLLNGCGDSAATTSINQGHAAASSRDGWVSAWGAAPYGPFPLGPLTGTAPVDPLSLSAISLFQGQQASDQSFRMIVHPTLGGTVLRIRLSNLMGDRPVTFSPVRVDKRVAGPVVMPVGGQPVLFGGSKSVTVAPGAEAVSDAVAFAHAIGDDLAISFHVVGDSGPMTWHAVSFSANYVGPPGMDVTADPSGLTFAPQPTIGWFFLSGVDVRAADALGAIVAFGDSITDGAYEAPESNTRWPDLFAQRLQAAGIAMSVINKGINSNTVTEAGTPAGKEFKGPPAVLRFQRDVLARSSVRSVVIFEGTNDITAGVKAPEIYAGIRSLVSRAHAAGLCVVLGTIMPRDDLIFGWDRATMEPERQALNALIRNTPGIEGIADFDKAMDNPAYPTHPNYLYYSPDLLHPTTLGFQIMAAAVPLEALVPPPIGRCVR